MRCPPARVSLPAGWRRLFVADSELACRLNDAQHRLLGANERLWSGLHPDALGLLCGEVRRVAPVKERDRRADDRRARGRRRATVETAMLRALERVHWTIRRAFIDYQSAYEERRRLAVDVGELSQQLTEVLCAAGWSEEAARTADVHELAGGGRAMIARCGVPSWGVSRIRAACAMTIGSGARSRRAPARDRRRDWPLRTTGRRRVGASCGWFRRGAMIRIATRCRGGCARPPGAGAAAMRAPGEGGCGWRRRCSSSSSRPARAQGRRSCGRRCRSGPGRWCWRCWRG